MSSSEEQEAFTTTNGSPEQPTRQVARVALFEHYDLAQEFIGGTLSHLNTLREVLQISAEGHQVLADFEGFSETQELGPSTARRASVPFLTSSPRRIQIPHRTVTSLVRNRVSEFEARSISNIPAAGTSGWLANVAVFAHSTNNTPQGSPISSDISSVSSIDMQEEEFSLTPGLPQVMEGAVGGFGYDGQEPHHPPPYSPPDLGTPIWHRVMADFPDLKEMVELVISNAQNALAGENIEREVLVGNKWAMETASTDVTNFNERLNTAEIKDSNRDD